MSPLHLAALIAPTLFTTATVARPLEQPAAKPRQLSVLVDGKGFHPNHITVERGQALTLVFERTEEKTCAKEVVFPQIDVRKPLPIHEKVAISVPTGKARQLAFQCGMGMYKSKLVITPSGSKEATR